METLHNDRLSIEVSSFGAELQSIKDGDGKEYLWQGDDKYWGRRSPILFPIVCGLWKGTYRTEGDTYSLGRHGFARDMNFQLLKLTEQSVTYLLHDNENTLRQYPYHFMLTVTYKLVSAQPTVYAFTDITGVKLGSIVRNGTQLQAPLAQVPSGWLSRLALTNTGSTARPYTIAVQGETGNTISTSNLTGTVPANGTTVIDLTTVLTGFTASPRATLNVTVAGPNNQIQGLYQIVNPDKGSISNHVLVRPGTN